MANESSSLIPTQRRSSRNCLNDLLTGRHSVKSLVKEMNAAGSSFAAARSTVALFTIF